MDLALPISSVADTPEARRYNRIKRWLGFADLALGFVFLLVLLVTGWSGRLHDFAYSGARQNYSLAVLLYVLFLLLIGKVLGFGLEYYGFRLEHSYHLSDQKLRSWLWDESKTFLLSWVLGTIVVELIYWTIRFSQQKWWLIAWAVFL